MGTKGGFAAPEIRVFRFGNDIKTEEPYVTPSGITDGLNSHQKILNKAKAEKHLNEVVTVLKWD